VALDRLEDGCLFPGGAEARLRTLALFGLTADLTAEDLAILVREPALEGQARLALGTINGIVRGGWFELREDGLHFYRHAGLDAHLERCRVLFAPGSPHASIIDPLQTADRGWRGILAYHGGGRPVTFGMFNAPANRRPQPAHPVAPDPHQAVAFLWGVALEMELVATFDDFQDPDRSQALRTRERYELMRRIHRDFREAIGSDYAKFRRAFQEEDPTLLF
jgi:hypothetical protein